MENNTSVAKCADSVLKNSGVYIVAEKSYADLF